MNLSAILFLPHQPEIAAFYAVQRKIYGNDWPPDDINQQYLLTCLLITKGEEPVARLCLYHNPSIGGRATLVFGNIEFVNEVIIFEKLLSATEAFALQNGYATLLGPINGSTWDEYRLPICNEGRQFITDLPQPLYYADFLLHNGFRIVQCYHTQKSVLTHRQIDVRLAETFKRDGITIRLINLFNYEDELQRIWTFCKDAFTQNVYYSPIQNEKFFEKYRGIKSFLNADFILIAENINKEVVALLLCLPDKYQSTTIVMKTMARSNQPQLRGLMTHMIDLFYNNAVSAGYTQLLHAFYHENNRSAILSEKNDGQPFKSYALFQKKVVE